MAKIQQQDHLDHHSRINLGSYYTNAEFVDSVWEMLDGFIDANTTIADTSCGCGNFFKSSHKMIGVDVDEIAINKAKKQYKNAEFFVANALKDVNRRSYNISNQKLCIIGNPPYNDRTSIIRHQIKLQNLDVDEDIQTRDLGMSFLLSYQKLEADVICVLHPLSYLIKQANFNLLKKFSNNYRLKQAKIISSNVFRDASKSMAFPIVIALYQKDEQGMNYSYIQNFNFEVDDKNFKLNDFDTITNYLKKYPNKQQKPTNDDILFWTMRDMNALKRNQTFVTTYSSNTVIIDKKQLDYYIYVDVLKQFSQHIPYYFGNCDILINDDLFKEYKKYFILECLSRHIVLRKYFEEFDWSAKSVIDGANKVKKCLKQLLGVHYVN
ncbi:MAG: SAM-dependent methyltransferase [Gammaproteobacteria bacterium]|nr:SAM-dependent methyltransferase [Gammaproteobacteria bacterium]